MHTHSSTHTPSIFSSQMVSLEAPKCVVVEPISSPRISFSAEFLDDNNFISICPKEHDENRSPRNAEFEFLSGDLTNMISADELFCEGKILPFCQMHHVEKLNKITLKNESNAVDQETHVEVEQNNDGRRISWFLDDDPSPRPPKCTVLWKELLRLKKQRASTLSPSSSSSSSSCSNEDERKKGVQGNRDKMVNRVKKGLERTRSATIRIRPMINVPICTAAKNTALPPLFSSRRGDR